MAAGVRIDYPFQPGQGVELLLQLDQDLSSAELGTIQGTLVVNGMQLLSPVDIGTGPWPNTLRLQFRYPSAHEVGMLPLAVLLVLALGSVGVGSFLGWKVGDVVGSIGKYMVPLALIFGGVYVLSKYVERPR